MSRSAAHVSKLDRKSCQSCYARKARFRFRGVVKADRDHVLCFECYRSARDRRRAQILAGVERLAPLRSPFSGASGVSGRQLAHRRLMVRHLEGVSQPR
jgi:hypothetical protein